MKVQKTLLKRMLLCLSSLLCLVFLSGCSKEYITKERFMELTNDAYGIESSETYSNDYIKKEEVIRILEDYSQSVIESSDLSTYLTEKQATDLIDQSVVNYLNDKCEDIEQVELKDTIDLTDHYTWIDKDTVEIIDLDLQLDDVVMIEGIGYRVSGINGKMVTITQANLEDLVEEIEIDKEIEVDLDEIELEEGVSIASSSYPMKSSNPNITLEVNFTKGNIEISSDFGKLLGLDSTIKVGKETEIIHTQEFDKLSIIPDPKIFSKAVLENKSDEVELSYNKYSKGYKITGEITLSNISIHPKIKIEKGSIEQLSLSVSYECDSKLKYKGTISQDLKLGSIHVPIGSAGVEVEVGIYLNISANGEVEITLKHASTTKVDYQNGILKKVNAQSTDLIANGAIKLLGGPEFDFLLKVAGIRITNLELLTQAELKCDAKLSIHKSEDDCSNIDQVYLKYGVNGYAPIITLKFGSQKSLAKSLGITFEGKILNDKNTHCFPIYNNEILIYEYIVEKEEKDLSNGCLNISDYYLNLSINESYTLEITSLPSGYFPGNLVYEYNENMISLHDLTITALSPGISTLTISTSDHLYEVTCTIVVPVLESEEFTGL